MSDSMAFVTGVSRGLGPALALALLARGFDVVGIGRSAAPGLSGPRFRLVACDLAVASSLAGALRAVAAEGARAPRTRSVLVNNAAVAGPVGPLGTLDADEVAAAVATNLAAPIALCDAFLRAFTSGERRVINVSSGAAAMSLPGAAVYCAAKAALESLTRTMAAEADDPALQSIAVRPGVVDTPMQAFMRNQSASRLPDVAKFVEFHRGGQLLAAVDVATTIVERLVLGPVDSGRIYSIAELAP
jgi:benzil reductase ((S)-benzoin forming)